MAPVLSDVFRVSHYFDKPLLLTQYFSIRIGSGFAVHAVNNPIVALAAIHMPMRLLSLMNRSILRSSL